MIHSASGRSSTRLPQSLCDALQIRVDTLPHQVSLRMKAFINYCEGRIAYQSVRKACVRWGNEPALGLSEGWLSEHRLTMADFQLQNTPEITFIRQATALLLQDSQEVFDAGLEALVRTYLDIVSGYCHAWNCTPAYFLRIHV